MPDTPTGVVTTKTDLFHPEDGYDLMLTVDYDKQQAFVYLQSANGVPPTHMYGVPYDLCAALTQFSNDPLRSRVPYRDFTQQ